MAWARYAGPHAAIAALAVIFCGLWTSPGAAAPARDMPALRVAVPAIPLHFDPHRAAGLLEIGVAGELFQGLVARDGLGNLIPGAAHAWQVSSDGLTYHFALKPDLAWSDGTPLQAADFVAGLTRALAPATAAPSAGDLFPILGAAEFHAGAQPADHLGLSAPDPQTVQITLKQASRRFLAVLSRPIAAPIPRHRITSLDDTWTAPQNIVTNGPFMPAPTPAEGLLRNPHFKNAAAGAATAITFVAAPAAEDALSLVRGGDADMSLGFSFELPGGRASSRALKADLGPNLFFVAVNTRRKPFNVREARHALAMTIDREGILRAARLADGVPAYTMVPPAAYGGHLRHRAPYAALRPDMRAAIAEVLLSESGIGPLHSVTLDLTYAKGAIAAAAAKNIAAAWAKLGIRLRLEERSAVDQARVLREGSFDFALTTWTAADPDPGEFLASLTPAAGPQNMTGYAEPDFDRRLLEADGESDPARRLIILSDAEAVLIEDQPVLPVFFFTPLRILADRVEGWQPNAAGLHPLHLLAP